MEQHEVPAIVTAALPDILKDERPYPIMDNIYNTMRAIVRFSKRMLAKHNLSAVETCMALIAEIYQEGNKQIKRAIEKIYVLSFPGLQRNCTPSEWNEILSQMPQAFYVIYQSNVRPV